MSDSSDSVAPVFASSSKTQARSLLSIRSATRRLRLCAYGKWEDTGLCCTNCRGTGHIRYVWNSLIVLQILSPRVAVHLRALIVLPTRDLVLQVQETFEAIAKGRGLKVWHYPFTEINFAERVVDWCRNWSAFIRSRAKPTRQCKRQRVSAITNRIQLCAGSFECDGIGKASKQRVEVMC